MRGAADTINQSPDSLTNQPFPLRSSQVYPLAHFSELCFAWDRRLPRSAEHSYLEIPCPRPSKRSPLTIVQFQALFGFGARPIRLDYLVLIWAAVPWLWRHPAPVWWLHPSAWAAAIRGMLEWPTNSIDKNKGVMSQT